MTSMRTIKMRTVALAASGALALGAGAGTASVDQTSNNRTGTSGVSQITESLKDFYSNKPKLNFSLFSNLSVRYQNLDASNEMTASITEPVQELDVGSAPSSGNQNHFGFAGQWMPEIAISLVTYSLTSYSNAFVLQPATVILSGSEKGNFISKTNPLVVTVTGIVPNGAGTVSSDVVLTSDKSQATMSLGFTYVTNVQLSRVVPGLKVTVKNGPADSPTTLAVLKDEGPAAMYYVFGKGYVSLYLDKKSPLSFIYTSGSGAPSTTVQFTNTGDLAYKFGDEVITLKEAARKGYPVEPIFRVRRATYLE